MQHVEKETNVGQLQGQGSQKRRNDKGAAAAAGGSDGITVLRDCLARWKANARSTRESGH